MPCSCIETLTIVEQEDTPQVGSLLPIGQDPISNGYFPNTGISISNSRKSVGVMMT